MNQGSWLAADSFFWNEVFVQQTMKTASSDEELAFKQSLGLQMVSLAQHRFRSGIYPWAHQL